MGDGTDVCFRLGRVSSWSPSFESLCGLKCELYQILAVAATCVIQILSLLNVVAV